MARCHSDDPIALHVVSMPAISSSTIDPRTCSYASRLPSSSTFEQVRGEVVARVGRCARRSGGRCTRRAVGSWRSRSSAGRSTCSITLCTNPRNTSSSSGGNPSMRAITLTGMLWAYCTAASTTDSPGTTAPMRSSSSLHSARTSGSHGSIAFGENGGSSSRRAIWWNGGSLVIGGAGPTGAAMPGRALLTIDAVAGEVLGVVGDLVHQLVRDRRPHAAVPRSSGRRGSRPAQLVPDRVGVGVVRRVGVIEVGRPVADRGAGRAVTSRRPPR